MNIEQIRTAAGAQSPLLSDPSCVNIYVGSSAADAAANVGAGRIAGLLTSACTQRNLRARIVRTGSFGCSDLEPLVRVEKPGFFAILYNNVTPGGIAELIEDAVHGSPRKALCCAGEQRLSGIPHISELPLFGLQKRIALRNCGWIDPEDISHYILQGQGYTGLARALQTDPSELAGTLIPSALRGRRASGCSTADKWRQIEKTKDADAALICNAFDPESRALAAPLLLESDPHSVLEGMLIAAYAAGAARCIVLIEEKTEAAERLRRALGQMRNYGLLGSGILDSRFGCEIEIRETPRSLTSGQRMEMLRCLEEGQRLPHLVPAFPAVSELAGKPVLTIGPEIASVLSGIPLGGPEESGGTRVVSLSGNVVHKRTVEVPVEMSIRAIIENFGGGAAGGKAVKTVQLGGLAGPFIDPAALDLPIGSDTVEELSSGAGTGSVEVLGADSRMVHATKEIMAAIQSQSCGKCVFCREGCLQLLTILEDILENKRRPQDLDLLAELGDQMQTACLCAFGRMAPNPVLSAIELFRDEYED